MGMKRALFAIFAFTACVTTNANTTTRGPQQAQADDVVCQEVQKPGSMLTHQVCRDRAEMDQEREQMRDVMLSPKAFKSCMGHSDHGGGCR
jgi:hypothetical protein